MLKPAVHQYVAIDIDHMALLSLVSQLTPSPPSILMIWLRMPKSFCMIQAQRVATTVIEKM